MKLVVLGDPVAQSLSPVMHNAALAHVGLSGWRYEAMQVEPARLSVRPAQTRFFLRGHVIRYGIIAAGTAQRAGSRGLGSNISAKAVKVQSESG